MTSKNIGIFHYQVGHTDGVSLEIEKWQRVLEEMGHRVYLCAGDLGSVKGTLIPEMYHHRSEVEQLAHNTFIELSDFDETGFQAEFERQVNVFTEKLRAFLVEREIDLIVVQNIWCLGMSPSLAVALENVRRELNLPALAHHHDFYWERVDDKTLTCAMANEVVNNYLPPAATIIRHVVINSLAQAELLKRKGVMARIVPNIFDFDAPPWKKDEYNRNFRAEIGLGENDLLILQATRIIPRKSIELAIDVTREIALQRYRLEENGLFDGRSFTQESRIVLVLAGYARDGTSAYVQKLKEKASANGVELLFIEEWIASERGSNNGHQLFSLWDAYVFADLVTYPSLWEGWGNQFLEAVRAELPIVLFEYPVYRADICDKGFEVISLGAEVTGRDAAGLVQISDGMIRKAAEKSLEVLTDPVARQRMVQKNLKLGQRYYSMNTLQNILEDEINNE